MDEKDVFVGRKSCRAAMVIALWIEILLKLFSVLSLTICAAFLFLQATTERGSKENSCSPSLTEVEGLAVFCAGAADAMEMVRFDSSLCFSDSCEFSDAFDSVAVPPLSRPDFDWCLCFVFFSPSETEVESGLCRRCWRQNSFDGRPASPTTAMVRCFQGASLNETFLCDHFDFSLPS